MRTLKNLDLLGQWESQMNVLKKTGIVVMLPAAKTFGIIGIDGKEYPVPSLDEVTKRVKDNEHFMLEKAEQGFTKLVLEPFAYPLTELGTAYWNTLLAHSKEKKLFFSHNGKDGKPVPLELGQEVPFRMWAKYTDADIREQLRYFPDTLETLSGEAKIDIIRDPENAWGMWMLEDLPDLPRQKQGRTVGGRKQIEGGISAKECLELLDKKPYLGEIGVTPETELMFALTILEERNLTTNQTADPDPEKDFDTRPARSLTLGAYLAAYHNGIPQFGWDHSEDSLLDFQQPGYNAEMYYTFPDSPQTNHSFRVGIKI